MIFRFRYRKTGKQKIKTMKGDAHAGRIEGDICKCIRRERGITVFFAPGRVNLIGEHTDYNGGHVFPCALTMGTYAAVAERKDGLVRLYSDNFQEAGIKECNLDGIRYQKEDDWANYPKGVIYEFQQRGYSIPHGFDIVFSGNIPNGAGLSSSASIELLMAVVLQSYFHPQLDALELVKMAQHAENTFIGVNCGIMDQFAIGMGKEHHAMLLNCDTLDYEYSKLDVSGLALVIANTNKKGHWRTQAIMRDAKSAVTRCWICKRSSTLHHLATSSLLTSTPTLA